MGAHPAQHPRRTHSDPMLPLSSPGHSRPNLRMGKELVGFLLMGLEDPGELRVHPSRCGFKCMDVWMYGRMDAWMYGCMDVWMYGCMDVWMHGWMYACVDVWTPVLAAWLTGGISSPCPRVTSPFPELPPPCFRHPIHVIPTPPSRVTVLLYYTIKEHINYTIHYIVS